MTVFGGLYLMRTKICTKCGQEKSLEDFHQDKSHKDGRCLRCKICRARYHKQWWQKVKGRYQKSKRQWREHHLKVNYGITIEQYKAMISAQNNTCKICGNKEVRISRGKITKLGVDHNHRTGRIRGLLCASCNSKLGWYEKNKKQILSYLKGDK